MDLWDPGFIPYRLRIVRVGVQVTAVTLVAFLAFHFLPGGHQIPNHIFFPIWAVAAGAAIFASVLPWDRMFRSRAGKWLLYTWSVVDILLITLLIALVPQEGPSLFYVYVLTTIFFALSYPPSGQITLLVLTGASYTFLFLIGETAIMTADLVLRLGLLAAVAMIASFASRELLNQVAGVARSHDEVEQEKGLYRSLLDAQSDLDQGMAIADLETQRFLYVNDAMCRMLGYSRDEFLHLNYMDLFASSDDRVAERLRQEREAGEHDANYHRDFRLVRKDGATIVVEMVTKQLDETRVVGIGRDVTEQRALQSRVFEREELFRAISEMGSDYAYSMRIEDDGSLSWEWVTDAYERVTGFTPEEAQERGGWQALVHPDDLARLSEILGRSFTEPSDEAVVSEFRIVTKFGEVKDLRVFNRVVFEDGRPIRIYGMVHDITEAKKAELALRASEERYRSLFERVPIALFLRTPGGEGLDANPACVQMFGFPDRESFIATQAESLWVRPEDREQWVETIERGDTGPFEVEFRRLDGTTFWGRMSGRAVRETDGSVLFYEGAIQDVSDRKRVEQDRERTLSLLRATIESTWDGVLVVDHEGHIVEFNQRFVQMWGISEEILRSGDDSQALAAVLDHLKDPHGFLKRVDELYKAPEEESFDLIEFNDGRVFERFSSPQRLPQKIVGRVWTFHDVTERRALEDQLRQSQKMEAVGRLAGGVAHDFNNLLTAVLGYCELLLATDISEPARDDVREIEQAAQMGADIASQLLDLSRRRVLHPEVLDLNEVVRSIEPMLRRLVGDDVIIEDALSDESCTVEADRAQMEQIVLNLVVNAGDAIAEGGEVCIRTRKVDVTEAMAAKSLRLSAGHHAILEVSDNGEGIDPAVRERIFEPFFTTRGGPQATGLGLSTVYGIVSQYNGHIEVESELGAGASFRVYLPEAIKAPVPLARARAAERWLSGTETVLVVEDDGAVRRLTKRTLERFGYSVVEAPNGPEALTLLKQSSDPVDLMVTDVVMPGMNGRQLAEKVRDLIPDLRILYMSGYTGEVLERIGDLGRNEDFLAKPFRTEDLASKVRELLNRDRGETAIS